MIVGWMFETEDKWNIADPGAIPSGNSTSNFDALHISIINDPGEILAQWQEFEAFAVDYSSCSAWLNAWYVAHSGNKRLSPFIIVGKSPNGTTQFLLPFMKRAIGPFNLLIRPGVKHSAYFSGIFTPELAGEISGGNGPDFWRHVLASIPKIDAIWLEGVPKGRLNLFAGEESFSSSNACTSMRIDSDWDSQYHEIFNSKARNNDKRGYRNLAKLGEVKFSVLTERGAQEQLLVEMLEQKSASLRKNGQSTLFEQREILEFYQGLLAQYEIDENASILLSKLCVDDEMLSANLGIMFNNRFYGMIISTTNSNARRHSPGRLLLLELNRYLSQNGIVAHDFGTGVAAYKNDWCDETIERFHVLMSNGAKGKILARAIRSSARLKAWAKQSKYKSNVIKTLGWTTRIRSAIRNGLSL